MKTPFIAKVGDYHEFDDIVRAFKFASVRVAFTEVGFDGKYVAVFYLKGKKRLAKDMIVKALKKYDEGAGE